MMSSIVDGKVLDWKFKQGKVQKFIYNFYIGDIFVGQVFNMKRYWSVVGKTPNKLCPVDGFKTRWKAAEFLLKLEGLQNNE